jgi:ATP-binding cassette subfamily B protein
MLEKERSGRPNMLRSLYSSSRGERRRKEHSPFRDLVFGYLRQAKRSLFLASLGTLGLTISELLQPWPLKIAFDQVLLDKPLPSYLSLFDGLFQGGKALPLVVLSLAIVVIALSMGAFAYLQIYISSRIGSELVYTIRRRLFAHLQRLSLSFHDRSRSGEHMTKLVSDTNTMRDVFTESALTFASQLLTFLGMFAIMFALNWELSLIVMATFPFLLGTLLYRYRSIKSSSRQQRNKEEKIANRISEVMTTVPLVQAFGRERYEEKRFESESSEYLEENIRTARLEAVATRSVTVIGAFGTAAVVLYGSLQALAGWLTPGDLLIFAAYAQSMYKPVRSLAKISTKFSKAAASAERLGEILSVEPEIQDSPDAVEASTLKGGIVFENVSFDYGDNRGVLRNVSFAVQPGHRVAVVGASGAGKSTLASLILRLYEPRQGSIYVDGVNIKDYQCKSLRRQIGIVLQDSILFGTTIKENIAYGKLDASMEEIIDAAKTANVHDFITNLEDGYETIIGERGDTLSGGQRQRIAIARAVVRNAPILILDEPMTGLDVESEANVQEALDRLMAGSTCFLITHDLQSVADADLVLVLEEGRIVAQGTHSDLMAGSRQYRKLHQLKISQREVEEDHTNVEPISTDPGSPELGRASTPEPMREPFLHLRPLRSREKRIASGDESDNLASLPTQDQPHAAEARSALTEITREAESLRSEVTAPGVKSP